MLVVGEAREALLRRLDARGCAVTCIILGDASPDEARVFCSAAYVVAPERASLESLCDTRFSAIILDGALDMVADPWRLVAESRRLVSDDGVLVALFGKFAGSNEGFIQAGFTLEHVDRIEESRQPIFALLARPAVRSAAAQPGSADTLSDLRRLLEVERSARSGLHAAFREMERSTSDLVSRVSGIAARREQMRSELAGRDAEIERLEALLSGSKAQLRELERSAAKAHLGLRTLRGEVEAEKTARERLRELLELKSRALESAQDSITLKEEELIALNAALENIRARADELSQSISVARRDVQDANDRAARLSAAETAANRWAEGLKQTITDLQTQIGSQTETERVLREQLTHLNQELETSRRNVFETEGRLGDEIQELRARVADAEHALAAQTDSLIDTMRAESTQLSTLIDAVQSSRFWRLKRWLNRLRGRLPS